MQGQLKGEPLTVQVTSECAHCGERIGLEIDNKARSRVIDSATDPIAFIPDVDFSRLADKCITDAF